MGTGRHVDLRDLAERIRSIERRHDAVAANQFIDPPSRDSIPTGWADIDAALGGLDAGGLHEWFGVEEAGYGGADRRWTPPLCILIHLAWQALDRDLSQPWVVWIGKRCHPYPRALVRGGGRDRRLLERSLFIAPRDGDSRLWAIDLALRSAAIGTVVADGSGFDRAATQRIQLAARTQMKAVFTACPPGQRSELSAAQTRWRVRAAPPAERNAGSGVTPGWSVELLRCKGVRPAGDRRVWLLEWNRAESAVDLSARLADLAGPPEEPVQRAEPVRRKQRTA